MSARPRIAVVGSVNLDLVATAARLPLPGETVTEAVLGRYPGGKGANQALAAQRLGADVRLIGRTGNDAFADEALQLLVDGGVDLSGVARDDRLPTGVALILVGENGENQIVVAPGANRGLKPEHLAIGESDALICQLEVPMNTIAAAVSAFSGFVCLNAAPAAQVPEQILERCDLVVLNDTEAAMLGDAISASSGLVALTHGKDGAELLSNDECVARARPPGVVPVDTTAAGDTFTAALTLALVEGQDRQAALEFACRAGALATTIAGAQPSLPYRSALD